MDLKITKKRISEHLAYDWTKYLAIILVCVFVMSLFYIASTRRLTDKQELKIVVYGQFVGKFNNSYPTYLKNATSLFDTEYVDTVIEYYATKDDIYSQQAASVKTEASFTMGTDIYVLPVLEGLIDANGMKKEDGSFFLKGEDDSLCMKEDAALTFNYRIGRNYFITVEELIESYESLPEAQKLKAFFESHPEYFYKSQRIVAWDEEPFHDQIANDGVVKTYGIDLNKLNLAKTTELVNKEGSTKECNYVLGVVRNSMSHKEAICFLNWFIETYVE